MKLSCNGCRVLRKGCSDNCIIRPCLNWIESPEFQANATLFLAKFYGRAGLINLIEAGPQHLRPAVFRSLLYEACGRVVNPVLGSAGLLYSGHWKQCEAAVEAVLRGSPPMQSPVSTASVPYPVAPLKTCDIRHVFKESISGDISRVKSRTRFKRSMTKPKTVVPSTSHGSRSTQIGRSKKKENGSLFSGISVEEPLLNQSKPQPDSQAQAESGEVVLDLTLGLAPPSRC